MFKRPVWSSPVGEASLRVGRFFYGEDVDIYIYSDESGVFDYKHRKFFVMAGILFTDKMEMDSMIRRYKAAENNFRKKKLYKNIGELKASRLSFDDRRNLFRLTACADRFAFIINMNSLDKKKVFESSKTKQMHLDWAFKVGIKKVISRLIEKGSITSSDSINIHCFIDEHTTATKGIYGLEEAIFKELHEGTINFKYGKYFEPISKNQTLSVTVKYVNSEAYELIRAADIIANRVLFEIEKGNIQSIEAENLCLRYFPYDR